MSFTRRLDCQTCSHLGELQESTTIFTSEYWTIVLADDQLYLGRAYLISLNHVGEIEGLSDAEILDWHHSLKRYSVMTKKAFGATHITEATLMNNAYQSDQPRPHVHTHIRPRYNNPYYLPGWHITFTDPNFGHHHLPGESNDSPVSREVLVAIAYQLRSTEHSRLEHLT